MKKINKISIIARVTPMTDLKKDKQAAKILELILNSELTQYKIRRHMEEYIRMVIVPEIKNDIKMARKYELSALPANSPQK